MKKREMIEVSKERHDQILRTISGLSVGLFSNYDPNEVLYIIVSLLKTLQMNSEPPIPNDEFRTAVNEALDDIAENGLRIDIGADGSFQLGTNH